MKKSLGISNIAWSGESDDNFLSFVSDMGVSGIELAASIVWDEPINATYIERESYRLKIEKHGLKISGLHALLYSRPDLQLFSQGEEKKRVINYLMETIDLCKDLGGKFLVLGSGKNRIRGKLNYNEAFSIAAKVLKELGDYAHSRNCILTIEPLPSTICDFIINMKEALDLVEMVNSPGVKLHFDSGSADITESDADNDKMLELFQNVQHCQVNDFELLPPGSTDSSKHLIWSKYLNLSNYQSWINIEMRRCEDPRTTIEKAIKYIKNIYFI